MEISALYLDILDRLTPPPALQQGPEIIQKSILSAADFWIVFRMSSQVRSEIDALGRQVRLIISRIQASLAQPEYFRCGDPPITLSSRNIVLSVAHGTVSDLLISTRITLSSKSAVFRLPDEIGEFLVLSEGECTFWQMAVFAPVIYQQEEGNCRQWISELTILTPDGTAAQIVELPEDFPVQVTFLKEPICAGIQYIPVCIYNAFLNDLTWQEGDCVLQEDNGARARFSVSHLTDFSLAYRFSSASPHPSTSFSISIQASLSNTPFPSPSKSQSEKEQTEDVRGAWFWLSLIACAVAGGLAVFIFVGFLLAIRKWFEMNRRDDQDGFAWEMEELSFDSPSFESSKGDEDDAEHTFTPRLYQPGWTASFLAPLSIGVSNLWSRLSQSRAPQETLEEMERFTPSENVKEEQVYVFSSKERKKLVSPAELPKFRQTDG